MKKWCVMRVPLVEGRTRGAILLDAAWPVDRVIRIAFLGGDEGLQARVRAVAQQWLDRTNARLIFEWLNDPATADIRISFIQGDGSWSLLGRYCTFEEDKTKPTMNYGWLTPESSDLEVQEVVLHEFGHALGLIHEHQHPEADIPWDRDAVIADLSGPPNYWTVEEIEHNVLNGETDRVLTTPYDEHSIMLYPIDNAWTIGDYETSTNIDFSERDIQIINMMYG